MAGWGDLEALVEFYEALLEEFWVTPPEGFQGPAVDDLQRCEKASHPPPHVKEPCVLVFICFVIQAAWQAVSRLMTTAKCSMEDALQDTAANLVKGQEQRG